VVAVTSPAPTAFGGLSPDGLRLVLHHDYTTATAEDLSGHGNDGALVGGEFVDPGEGSGGIELDGLNDRIVVRPSGSLAHLSALRVDVNVLLHSLGERRDLVEGYLSFAVFVHDDGSVQGGVYDRSGWLTIRSAAGCVEPGRWVRVSYACDPELGSHLYVDGVLVQYDGRVPTAFGDVSWPFGLNVGAWPDADLFMLRGRVADVMVLVDDGQSG
jgi:hypothetical protein